MIIVSQDDLSIVNFDNIKGISIDCAKEWRKKANGEQEMKNVYTVVARINKDFSCVLGGYDKESRAKEVLREIINMFSINETKNKNYEETDLILKFISLARYEMPKE